MTKKQKKSAADELFDSLLEDVKQDDTNKSSNFEGSVNIADIPEPKEESLHIPELHHGNYQSQDEVFVSADKKIDLDAVPIAESSSFAENVPPVYENMTSNNNDKTYAIEPSNNPIIKSHIQEPLSGHSDLDRTVAVTAFAKKKKKDQVEEKVIQGSSTQRSNFTSQKPGQVYTSIDASLAQADSLKLAQQRIIQLEKELESFRQENDDLASAAEIIKQRSEELENKMSQLENEKNEIRDQAHSEVMILKGNLQFKEMELGKARLKVEELESRLKSDFKKIRTKERELENRLELARAEKQALVRAKDDNILELQRKIDQLKSELDNYRSKVFELNKTLDGQNEQIRRTVRALRLGLTTLEVKSDNIVPLKKAE